MTSATATELGIVVNQGMGGFLNPPMHPEHNWSVEFDLKRQKHNRGSMSLSAAVECEWLTQSTRDLAQHKLDSWQRPAIESEEVQAWIRRVLGYFSNCYKGSGPEPECWHADRLRILKTGDDARPNDEHAGVHLIRQYYPEYHPAGKHFTQAKWGR